MALDEADLPKSLQQHIKKEVYLISKITRKNVQMYTLKMCAL